MVPIIGAFIFSILPEVLRPLKEFQPYFLRDHNADYLFYPRRFGQFTETIEGFVSQNFHEQ